MKIPSQRIISLTASITETLYALGLEDRVAGVTDTCDYPQAVNEKPNVNCWFEPDIDKLVALKPDLVIGSETAHRSLKRELAGKGFETILVDPQNIDDVLALIKDFGSWLGVNQNAAILVDGLRVRLTLLDSKVSLIPEDKRFTTCRILQWDEGEIYVAGPLSYQYDVIQRAGGLNVTGDHREGYPKVSVDQLRKWDPVVIFFCGYEKDFILRVLNSVTGTPFQAVAADRLFRFDCGLTCRSGPRIVDMAELLHKSLYADLETR